MENVPECVLALNECINENVITTNSCENMDYMLATCVNYQENFTVKMLRNIAIYYGFKCSSKTKKQVLIDFIMDFEQNKVNGDIVARRCTLWNYMDELLEDPFTRKFVVNMNK